MYIYIYIYDILDLEKKQNSTLGNTCFSPNRLYFSILHIIINIHANMKGVDFSVIYMYISYIGIFVGQMVTRHPWGIGLEKKHPLRGHDEVMFLYETIEMYLNTAAADSGRTLCHHLISPRALCPLGSFCKSLVVRLLTEIRAFIIVIICIILM